MQRKKYRDYADSIEKGHQIGMVPVAQMRKLTAKKVIKYTVLAVIAYVIYSAWDKMREVSSRSSSKPQEDLPGDTWKEVIGDNKADAEQKLRDQARQIFDEFNKKKEVEKQKIDQIKEDQVALDDTWLPDDGNGDDGEGDDGKDVLPNDKIKMPANDDQVVDELKSPNEEKGSKEIEMEIEEQIAEAFKEAVDVAFDKAVDNAEKKIADESIKAGDQKALDDLNSDNVDEGTFKHEDSEKKEFNEAVKKIASRLNPLQLEQQHILTNRKTGVDDDDHELPPIITAVRQSTMEAVMQLISSIQNYLPGRKVYVYDLDLNKFQKKQLVAICGVRVRLFMKDLFPNYISNYNDYHWRPLVIQTALAEFGHIFWINPTYQLISAELAPLVHDSHEKGVAVIAQSVSYSTFSVTHPEMLKFIKTDKAKLTYHPHLEIFAMMIHNTPEVHENIMKLFTACALEKACLAPDGAKWQCQWDFTGRKHANCHRYDESALNILLKNMFDYDSTKFAHGNTYFRPYEDRVKPKLKYCRDPSDIRDSEL
ncbi:hypothetical protein CHS0354_015630 [Potamilus streckersoni]|uniref:Uncharacterized protein n=1 Tax=Potamilus streckersoni TaxID=2493646 RepID=A0AAE0W7L9_9BIVA|nr:hypothetical protein CHS0354_015630 [Potamilus streckersoni]